MRTNGKRAAKNDQKLAAARRSLKFKGKKRHKKSFDVDELPTKKNLKRMTEKVKKKFKSLLPSIPDYHRDPLGTALKAIECNLAVLTHAEMPISIRKLKTPAKRAFLMAYIQCGNQSAACRACDISKHTPYNWGHHPSYSEQDRADYLEAFEDARDLAGAVLELQARRRAILGTMKKKFTKDGSPIIDPETGLHYVEFEVSDALLLHLLKSFKPEVYDRAKPSTNNSTNFNMAGGLPVENDDGTTIVTNRDGTKSSIKVVVYLPENGRDDPVFQRKLLGLDDPIDVEGEPTAKDKALEADLDLADDEEDLDVDEVLRRKGAEHSSAPAPKRKPRPTRD